MQILQADSNYFWFTLVLTLLLVGLYFFFTQRIGKSIKQLRQFAKKMEAEEIPDPDSLNFPTTNWATSHATLYTSTPSCKAAAATRSASSAS